jgi:hypothetical protein
MQDRVEYVAYIPDRTKQTAEPFCERNNFIGPCARQFTDRSDRATLFRSDILRSACRRSHPRRSGIILRSPSRRSVPVYGIWLGLCEALWVTWRVCELLAAGGSALFDEFPLLRCIMHHVSLFSFPSVNHTRRTKSWLASKRQNIVGSTCGHLKATVPLPIR